MQTVQNVPQNTSTYIPPTLGGLRAVTIQNREFAEERMSQYIRAHRDRAQATVNRLMSEIPHDAIVRAEALTFDATDAGLRIGFGNTQRSLNKNALAQMSDRVGIPTAYTADLNSDDAGWKRELLAHTLGQHFQNDAGRYLVRSIGSDVRGFMSDRYRRIDCRPVLDTLIKAATAAGALIVDGVASDVRASIKAIIPTILEPFPGEFMVAGFSWTNSDFGKGANQLEVFVGRLACWNGMVAEKGLRQIHLGRKLDDAIDYSDRTLRLDTQTAVSAVNDVAKHFLSPTTIKGYIEAIASANATPVDGKAAETVLARRTTKATAKAVVDKFNSADVVELPPGNTEWRWGQSIAMIARDATDADNKIDLERLAGEVLSRHGLKAA